MVGDERKALENLLDESLELYEGLAKAAAKKGLGGYFRYLVVDSVPPRRFTQIVEPWQQKIYDFLTPLFEIACGIRLAEPDEPRAAMITAGRGSSKSSTIAQYCNWALNFAHHNVSIVVGAADQDQANILLDRMKAEAAKNPYLDLTFRHYKIFGPTGRCEITSSEAATSAGRSDHITVVDELVWHQKPDLWQLLSTGGYIKRKDGILVCLTNSGIQNTWQHTLWLAAKESREWISYDVPPFAPSWLDRKKIDEQRKTLLPAYFARLFENRWIDPNEENAYLTKEQVKACETIKKPLFGGNHYYVCGVDAAFVHDRTVACICHAEGEHVYLDEMKVWEGSKSDRFQLSQLEDWFADVQTRFRVKLLVVDPTQLEGFVQKNEGRMEVERFSFNAKHKQLAETVRSLVLSQRLHIYESAGPLILRNGQVETLLDELPALIVKESEGGNWRVDHVPGKHDDRYSALSMCCLHCVTTRAPNPFTFAENLEKVFKLKKDEDMEYDQVKRYEAYGTYVPWPVLNGVAVKLADYGTAQEAAIAVNEACKLLGQKAPHSKVMLTKRLKGEDKADEELTKKRTEEIRVQVEKQLRDKKLLIEKKEKAK